MTSSGSHTEYIKVIFSAPSYKKKSKKQPAKSLYFHRLNGAMREQLRKPDLATTAVAEPTKNAEVDDDSSLPQNKKQAKDDDEI